MSRWVKMVRIDVKVEGDQEKEKDTYGIVALFTLGGEEWSREGLVSLVCKESGE